MKAKILIVGGGVMGTSIAMQAAPRTDSLSDPVVLLERTELGAGSSGRSGAILRQFYADRGVASMARDALRVYSSFAIRTGRRIGFRRTGVLTLARGETGVRSLRGNLEVMQDAGIDARLVEPDEIRRLMPGIQVADDGLGVFEPDGGFVDAARTVREFGALARSLGAVTRLGTTVDELLVENGRMAGVRCGEQTIEAEKVVLVAGPWTQELLRTVDIDLPLRVIRPETHFLQLPHAEDAELEKTWTHTSVDMSDPLERISEEMGRDGGNAHLHPVLIDLENEFYCRDDPVKWRMFIGRTNYASDQVLERADDLTEEVSAETVAWARDAVASRVPAYAELEDAGSEAAWYTLTPDAQPVIGPLRAVENLFVVAGFSGHGFKLAPSIGEGVTQMLFDEPVSAFDTEQFAPERFDANPTWVGQFGL